MKGYFHTENSVVDAAELVLVSCTENDALLVFRNGDKVSINPEEGRALMEAMKTAPPATPECKWLSHLDNSPLTGYMR